MNGVEISGAADQTGAGAGPAPSAADLTLLDLALSSAADVVLMQDVDGRCVWVSPACLRVLGWSVEDLVGHRGKEFVHPDDLGAFEDARQRARAAGAAGVEYRFRCGDGSYRWVEARRRDLDAGPAGITAVVTVRDVDEAVATRQALEASQARLHLVAQHSRDAIVLTRGRLLEWCSPAIEDLLGLPAEEMAGQQLADFVHPDDQTTADSARARLDTGHDTRLRVRLRHRDGSWHWVDIRVAAVDNPADPTGLRVANLRLVDDEVVAAAALRAQQAALADSERRYRLVVDNSFDAITVTDRGVLRWASPAITKILGDQPDDLVGTQLFDRVHPDDHTALEAVRARMFASHAAQAPIKMRVQHRNGSWHWIELHVAPLIDDNSEVAGAVANWRLIDDQVAYLDALTQSEARNRELAAQLQHALESRVLVEQAKGMVAAERHITVDEAFEVLRTYARNRGAKLHDVAHAVVNLGLRP